MIFSSIEFVVFLTVVFALYWFVINKNLKLQNALLLLASYVFYGWWDWRFLFLLIFISGSNYLIGLYMDRSENEKKRKLWLTAGLVINLGVHFFQILIFIYKSVHLFNHSPGLKYPRSLHPIPGHEVLSS